MELPTDFIVKKFSGMLFKDIHLMVLKLDAHFFSSRIILLVLKRYGRRHELNI